MLHISNIAAGRLITFNFRLKTIWFNAMLFNAIWSMEGPTKDLEKATKFDEMEHGIQ